MPDTRTTPLDAASMTNLLEQLKRHEGCRKDKEGRHICYRCPAGKQTIGYGHNLDAWPVAGVTPDTRLSEAEATNLLRRDVEQVMEQVSNKLPWAENLNHARRAVLINMAFNMGIVTLLTFKNTLNAVKNGEYAKAAEGMLASKWAGQVHGRATELAVQMRSGQWA